MNLTSKLLLNSKPEFFSIYFALIDYIKSYLCYYHSIITELCKFKISDKNNKDKGCVKGIFYEDVYFTNLIRENYPKSLPSLKECDEFAIESFGDYTKAIGIHGTDKYYAKPEFYKKIFQYLNNNKK